MRSLPLLFLVALAALGACRAQHPQESAPAAAAPGKPPAAASSDEDTAVPADADQRFAGAVPPALLRGVTHELASRLAADKAEIRVAEQQAVRWRSSALGCPKPGLNYNDVMIDGYRIVLEHAGKRYVYHANGRGYFLLCDNPPAHPGYEPRDPT